MKHCFTIDSVDDVLFLKNNRDSLFDTIYLVSAELIILGVFDCAVKYAFWRLQVDGEIIVICPPSNDQIFSHRCPNGWQVTNILSRKWFRDMLVMSVVKSDNRIVLKKRYSDKYSFNGVSIGILFSGSEQEEPLLFESLSDVVNPEIISYEIVLCGPRNYDFSRVKKVYPNLNIRYLAFDAIADCNGRFLISKKKNYLYQNLEFDIRVIAHSRIKLHKNFISRIYHERFDVATPTIIDPSGKRYLDIALIGSYDVSRLNPKITLVSEFLGNNHLRYMRNRVVYIDGGFIVFNSKVVGDRPFNDNIAWCEGEDIELAKSCYYRGILLDVLDGITCISLVRKFEAGSGFIFFIKSFIKRGLISNGFM